MPRALSQTSHQAIIDAFVKLMAVKPINDITTEEIARAAGSSKSTLYSHWADKEALLIEVVAQIVASQPVADSGDFRRDAATVLRNMFVTSKRDRFGRIWPNIFSFAITHPKFCRAINEELIYRAPKHTLVAILRAAIASGRLRRDLDINFAVDLLAGPLMHHRFLHGRVPATLPESVVAAVWPVLSAG
jgi:AcrR family transcriptional regulator